MWTDINAEFGGHIRSRGCMTFTGLTPAEQYDPLMTEPLLTATAAFKAVGASIGVAKGAASGYQMARRRFRFLGTFDPEWIHLADSDDELGLTVGDVQSIERFLASPDVEPILALFSLSALSRRAVGEHSGEPDHAVQIALANQAKRWTKEHGGSWEDKVPQILQRLRGIYDGTFANADTSALSAEIDDFAEFISTPVLVSKPDRRNADYLDRLVAAATNLQKLVAVIAKARELANAIGNVDLPPILTHTEIEGSLDFEKLYVGRAFRRPNSLAQVSPDTLSPTTDPFRVVLRGNPGAGKSTFVRHYKKLTCSSGPVPVVEISCRRYAKSTWHKSIIDFAVECLQADHGVQVDADEFTQMLLLGRACLVFDGLDEITEHLKRAEMVERIQSIAYRNPACSILVTTRILGYEQARLPESLFDHLELDEFNGQQFREYCRNWFRLKEREDLTASFIDDSGTVADLRYNPLMLSLLCALYREHGALPTDRRDVYRQCAELLFRRWDAHRQVEHDGSMPRYAVQLMQEIAYWVYSSVSAQSGIEEGQLVKILAHFLRDRAGYDPADAETAAHDFVNFCATRAWLLASFGNNKRGQRVFAFTHRTFLEYFAAEALTRRAADDAEVIEKIKAAFSRDRTSVVPELIVQAYDFRKDNGGPLVLSELLRERVPGILLLRLMTGLNVSADLRRRLLRRVLDDAVERGFDTGEFELVLNLNPQAREQFISLFLTGNAALDHPEVTLLIASVWAGKCLHGSAGRLIGVWDAPITAAVLALQKTDDWMPDAAVANWMTSKGLDPAYPWLGWDALICPTPYGHVPGFLWQAIYRRFARGETTNKMIGAAMAAASAKLQEGCRIPRASVEAFNFTFVAEPGRFGLPHFARRPWTFPTRADDRDDLLRQALLWVLCASRESRPRYTFNEQLDDGLHDFWPGAFESAAKLRATRRSAGDGAAPGGAALTNQEADEARALLESVPMWLRKWFYAERSFIR